MSGEKYVKKKKKKEASNGRCKFSYVLYMVLPVISVTVFAYDFQLLSLLKKGEVEFPLKLSRKGLIFKVNVL